MKKLIIVISIFFIYLNSNCYYTKFSSPQNEIDVIKTTDNKIDIIKTTKIDSVKQKEPIKISEKPVLVKPIIPPKIEKKVSIIVYITRTGAKYHRGTCRYLSRSKIAISLQNAKSRGYTPCSVCKPPKLNH